MFNTGLLNRAICGGKATGLTVAIFALLAVVGAFLYFVIPAVPIKVWQGFVILGGVAVGVFVLFLMWNILSWVAVDAIAGLKWLVGGTVRQDIRNYRTARRKEKQWKRRMKEIRKKEEARRKAEEDVIASRLNAIRALMTSRLSASQRLHIAAGNVGLFFKVCGKDIALLANALGYVGLLHIVSWLLLIAVFRNVTNEVGEKAGILVAVTGMLAFNALFVNVARGIWHLLDDRSIPTASERFTACLAAFHIPMWGAAGAFLFGFGAFGGLVAFMLGLHVMAAALGFTYQCSEEGFFGFGKPKA